MHEFAKGVLCGIAGTYAVSAVVALILWRWVVETD